MAQMAEEWPVQAADTIVQAVGTVRDRTTGPAITVSRAIVYGLVAALLGVVIIVVLCIAVVRFLDVYLPEAWFGPTHVWFVYLLLGTIFVSVGAVLWSRRTASAA